MSIERVAEFARELPPKLREDVIGYARSVESALPEIFRDAGVAETQAFRDQLVFIAGVKKLHALCSSAYWILEHSLKGLQSADVQRVKLGGVYVERGSREWLQLRATLAMLETLLSDAGIMHLIYTPSYSEILTQLADGR